MNTRFRCSDHQLSTSQALDAILSNQQISPQRKDCLHSSLNFSKQANSNEHNSKPTNQKSKLQKGVAKRNWICYNDVLDVIYHGAGDEKSWKYLDEIFSITDLQGCYVDLTPASLVKDASKDDKLSCKERFCKRSEMKSESSKNTVIRCIKCTLCGRYFKTEGHLHRHQVAHRISSDDGLPSYMMSEIWVSSIAKSKHVVQG